MAEILVVEDYPQLASIVARNLRRRGHAVETALTVAEAMNHLHRTFDYAVLDIDLPDGDGISLAQYLLAQRCVTGVVFFTATCDETTLARATRLGKVIGKLGGSELLLQTLEEWQASERNNVDAAPISRVVSLAATAVPIQNVQSTPG